MPGPKENALVSYVNQQTANDLTAQGYASCVEIRNRILSAPSGQIRKMLDDWVIEMLPEWLNIRVQEIMEQYVNNQTGVVNVGDCRYENA